jgi:hypothetical protein
VGWVELSEMRAILLKMCAGLTLLFSFNFQTPTMPARRLPMNDEHTVISFNHIREEDSLDRLKMAKRDEL